MDFEEKDRVKQKVFLIFFVADPLTGTTVSGIQPCTCQSLAMVF